MSIHSLASAGPGVINLDQPGTYLHWSIFTVSVANLALIAVMVGTGLFVGRRVADRDDRILPIALEEPAPGGGERRQLQFSTPGGTRIIWVFDPGFHLKETMR